MLPAPTEVETPWRGYLNLTKRESLMHRRDLAKTLLVSAGPLLLPREADAQTAPSFPQTPAEQAASITPVNTAYLPRPVIDAGRYGCDPAASAAVNTTAINNALKVAAKGPGGVVTIPPGQIVFDGTLYVGSNTVLTGVTRGYGRHYSTSLYYIGTGVAIQVGTPGALTAGFYSRLSDFILKQAGSGSIGIAITATQFAVERVTIAAATLTGFSEAAIQTDPTIGCFTILFRDVYCQGNAIGIDLSRGNNFTIDHCFLESNGYNLRVGYIAQCTNVAISNGSVIELFGDGRSNEASSSIGINVYSCLGFTCRDSYFEVAGSGAAASFSSRQLGINIQSASGVVVEGNYFYGGGQATNAVYLQAVLGAKIEGNHFNSFAGYAVKAASAAVFEVGPNAHVLGLGVWDNSFTPTPSGLAVANGTGGAIYRGRWGRANGRIHFTIEIVVTGTCTTASTANVTYFDVSALPTPSANDVAQAVSSTDVSSYGNGLVATNSRCYTPTWTAANKGIVISGSYAA
jgi:hypothetical protein